MASVSQCDVCGKIGKHEKFVYLKMFNQSTIGNIGIPVVNIEICPECAKKVKELLKVYGNEQRKTV